MADEVRTEGESGPSSMLVELAAIDEEVVASAQEMERLVNLEILPAAALLSAARLRFSRALRRHLLYVDSTVVVQMRIMQSAKAAQAIEDFRALLNSYHQAAAHHVARWPSTRVAADWNGYRKSVVDMLNRLRERMEFERREIHPLLAGRDRLSR